MPDGDHPAECRLDLAGLRTQRERYRRLGAHVDRVERAEGRLVVDFSPGVDSLLVAETIEVERGCCPFFALAYDVESRRLTVRVDDRRHDPALDAIAFALGKDDQKVASRTPVAINSRTTTPASRR